jgi:2-C-methyl-D-erythritol 4-phosphate cytidylyltransferase
MESPDSLHIYTLRQPAEGLPNCMKTELPYIWSREFLPFSAIDSTAWYFLPPLGRRPERLQTCYTPVFMRVYVIIPAAGLGTRMAGGSGATASPKQFLELAGLPILIHSLRAFAGVASVAGIYVAVRPNEKDRVAAQVSEYGFTERITVVEGGNHRQHSVANALAAIDCAPDDVILVHDAVRPLIDTATIRRTIEAVEKHGAAIVALPAVDTIKQVERTAGGAIITSTIPREHIVMAQTPQGFRYDLLKRAFAAAAADEFIGTDEASLVERFGAQVAVVQGSLSNIKITHVGDIELAEFYLQRKPVPVS